MGHKASLSKVKKIEMISKVFSNCNGMRQESTKRKNLKKITPNMWRLNNMLLKNQWFAEEIKE